MPSASVITAFDVKPDAAANQIHTFGYDAADASTPYNLINYSVLEDLSERQDYNRILQAASVADGEELITYLHENVFMVKEKPGGDHWLQALPGSAIALMKQAHS